MKTLVKSVCLFVFGYSSFCAAERNWTPSSHKIQAQVLSVEIMAAHPELISITFHGVPHGLSKVYTIFAGLYPARIGNADDPDDVMIIELGITILDPHSHRMKDPAKKFVMMMPLRDAVGENCGLLVAAYQTPTSRPTAATPGWNDCGPCLT